MDANLRKKIIGYTRFSVYLNDSKHWLISQKKDYLTRIFNPERLDIRFDIFFNHTMSSIKKGINKLNNIDYTHFLFYSSNLPSIYKEQLAAKAKDYTFLFLVEVDSSLSSFSYVEYIESYLLKYYKDSSLVIGLFGIDDDDMLSVSYFQNVEHYLQKAFVGMRVSFCEGLTGYYDNGYFSSIRRVNFPKINIGIFSIGTFNKNGLKLPLEGNHMHLDKKGPVIIDSRIPMYFWTKHDKQDTNLKSQFNVSAMESLQLIHNKESVLNDFPTLEETGKFYTSIKEIGEFTPLHRKESLCTLNNSYTEYTLSVELEYKDLVVDKSVLITIEPLNTNSVVDMSNSGLYRSSNKNIGYFRYLSSDKKLTKTDFILRLPKEVDSFNISLFKYRETGTIIIKRVVIWAC